MSRPALHQKEGQSLETLFCAETKRSKSSNKAKQVAPDPDIRTTLAPSQAISLSIINFISGTKSIAEEVRSFLIEPIHSNHDESFFSR